MQWLVVCRTGAVGSGFIIERCPFEVGRSVGARRA
jgi:hypothetical protein